MWIKENFYKYLSNNSDDWGINIITCGYEHVPANANYPQGNHPKSHNFKWEQGRKLNGFHLVYIPTGSGRFETKHHKHEIHPGDVMFIYDKEWHRYRPHKKTGWEECWVGFDGNYLRNYVISDLFPDQRTYVKKVGYQEDILLLFDHFLELAHENSSLFRKILVGCLLELLAHFTTPSEKKIQTNRNAFIVEKTVDAIRNNIARDIDFQEMATIFHISYSHYRKIFKEHTGFSPHQFLINERIECSKRLLSNTDLTISEIAQKSGFRTIHYFSKIFKQKTGNSPSAKRRKYR